MPNTTSSLWKVWSMQPYLGPHFFPPEGLLKSEEREEFKAGESSSNSLPKLEDQATQTRKGGHRCYDIQHQGRNPKAEYRAADRTDDSDTDSSLLLRSIIVACLNKRFAFQLRLYSGGKALISISSPSSSRIAPPIDQTKDFTDQ